MRTVSNCLVMAFSQFVVVVSVFLAKAPKLANAQTNIFSYIATYIFTNIIFLGLVDLIILLFLWFILILKALWTVFCSESCLQCFIMLKFSEETS